MSLSAVSNGSGLSSLPWRFSYLYILSFLTAIPNSLRSSPSDFYFSYPSPLLSGLPVRSISTKRNISTPAGTRTTPPIPPNPDPLPPPFGGGFLVFRALSSRLARLRLMEGQRPGQVPAARGHAVILFRRPVVVVEQVVDQVQLRVAALRQAFFTSSMVTRR